MTDLFLGICGGAVLAFLSAVAAAHLLATAGFPLPSSEKRIGQIDGLRGFLALSVMVYHFIIWLQVTRLGGSWATPNFCFFGQVGSGAVALFFMATGLLFYPRILAGFRANSWPSVFISRIFRLVPMSAAAFVLVTLVVMLRTGHGLDARFFGAALQWISAAGMPHLLGDSDPGRVNAYVLWSLKYEWQFYLIALPLCAMLMDLLRPGLPSLAAPVAVAVVATVCKKLFPDVGLWRYMSLFVAGMLAYEAQSRPKIARLLKSRAATWSAIAALLIATILFNSPYDLAWPFYAMFFFAVAGGNDMGGLLRTRAALVLGECSYGIYLTHGIILFLLFTFGGSLTGLFATPLLPLLMPFAALAVVLLTATTYLLVERPGIRAGRYFSNLWRSLSARKIAIETE